MATDDLISKEVEEENEISDNNLQNSTQFCKSVSLTEGFSQHNASLENIPKSPQISTEEIDSNLHIGDLSKTLSFERSLKLSDNEENYASPKKSGKVSSRNDKKNVKDLSLELGSVSLDLSEYENNGDVDQGELPVDESFGNLFICYIYYWPQVYVDICML